MIRFAPRRPLAAAVAGLTLFGLAAAQPSPRIQDYLFSSTILVPNVTVSGSLNIGDGQNFKDGEYLDLYGFDGLAGEEVVLVVESTSVDTYLSLYSPRGELIESNDDLGSFNQSGLRVRLLESGRHLVVVSSFFGGETGAYTVTRYTPDQAPLELFEITSDFSGNGFGTTTGLPTALPLSVPTRIERSLSGALPAVVFEGQETYLEHFSFTLAEPRLVSIGMGSNQFDTYLVLFDQSGRQLASNDDDPAGFGTDSKITTSLQPGTYSVVATSLFGLETGSYLLEVELFAPAN